MTRTTVRHVSLVVATLVGIAPACAHHVMGGATPATFAQGLLSGLGHPVIGLAHLAFLLAVGLAVAASGPSLVMPPLSLRPPPPPPPLHPPPVNLPPPSVLPYP